MDSMFTPIPPAPPGMVYAFATVDGARRLVTEPVEPAALEERQRHREAVDASRRRRRETRARMFERDLQAMLAISDARKVENAAARARAQSNPALCTELLREAQRRGRSEVDWADYFRNVDIAL